MPSAISLMRVGRFWGAFEPWVSGVVCTEGQNVHSCRRGSPHTLSRSSPCTGRSIRPQPTLLKVLLAEGSEPHRSSQMQTG